MRSDGFTRYGGNIQADSTPRRSLSHGLAVAAVPPEGPEGDTPKRGSDFKPAPPLSRHGRAPAQV